MQYSIHVVPRLHCSACNSPLLLPHKRGQEVEPGFVLAECGICAIAMKVPVSAFQPRPPMKVESTVARPWADLKKA